MSQKKQKSILQPKFSVSAQNISSRNSLIGLIQAMSSVDINSPEAKLNKISMSDNNGGRIYF